jgi:hypothetical protein
MQKIYKILTIHLFWKHKSSQFKHWLCQRWLLKQRMHLGLSCPFCNVPFQLMQPSPLNPTTIVTHFHQIPSFKTSKLPPPQPFHFPPSHNFKLEIFIHYLLLFHWVDMYWLPWEKFGHLYASCAFKL